MNRIHAVDRPNSPYLKLGVSKRTFMMSLDTYPVLILPEFVLDYLKSKGKTSQTFASSVSPSFVPTVRRRTFTQTQLQHIEWFLHKLFLGILALLLFVFVSRLFVGIDSSELLLWLIILIFFLLGRWGGLKIIDYCRSIQQQDKQRFEELYWKHNRANNERLRQEQAKKLRRQVILRNELLGKIRRLPTVRSGITVGNRLQRGEIKIEAPKGVSEAHLAKFLHQYFSDCQIGEEYFAIEGTKVGYTTDFSIIEPTTGIGIDLEVDEPYEGKFKQPHHCTDNAKDRNRNKYLVERGWIVLRVSEFQVVSQPEAVCKLIAKIIHRLSDRSKYLEALAAFPDLIADNTWNSVGVSNMVYRKYRERYLDRYGIYAYDAGRERRNAADYAAKQQQQRREARARKRANLRAWRRRNN